MNADGGEQRQLTFDEPGSTSPSAVLGKDFVAYVSDSTGAHHVWRVNTDGSNKLQLTNGAGEHAPQFRLTGTRFFITLLAKRSRRFGKFQPAAASLSAQWKITD